jgi:hypothetical protein
MAKPSLDRDRLGFSEARHLKGGIEVMAEFFAPKVSNPDEGEEYYLVTLTIDPVTQVTRNGEWKLGNRLYSGFKDKLKDLEKQIRDQFIKTSAWEILVKRKPDPNYIVNELGEVIEPDPPIKRRGF